MCDTTLGDMTGSERTFVGTRIAVRYKCVPMTPDPSFVTRWEA